MDANLIQRITIDPDICHGKPTVRGMRYPVSMILDLLGAGMTSEEIIEDYPSLEKQDIYACLFYASKLTEVKTITKIRA